MRSRERKPVNPRLADPGAVFDAALARGLKLPDGLSRADARRYHVEHPPEPWTDQDHKDWLAHFRKIWQERQDDRRWQKLRAELTIGLGGQPFIKLDKMPIACDRHTLRTKLIESLADALDALRTDAKLREELVASREFAECDLQDARNRIGRHPEPWKRIVQDREAKAQQAIADIERMMKDRPALKRKQKEIIDGLSLDLFAIVRHVTMPRSVANPDWVSDKRIHSEAVGPILRAFAGVDSVVPRRTARSGSIQAASKKRLHEMIAAEVHRSKIAADIWRDGRQPETFGDILWRVRLRLFAWDTSFDPALLQNR